MTPLPPAAVVNDDEVRLAWDLTERDLAGAIAWMTRRKRGFTALIAAAAGFTIAQAGWLLGAPAWALWGGVAVAGVLVVHVMWVRPRMEARKLLSGGPSGGRPHALRAGRGELVLEAGTRHDTYPWSAIQGLTLSRDHLFLHLSSVQAVAVPRRVFGAAETERRAVAILRAWRRRAQGAPLPVLPRPGPQEVSLRYVLQPRDFVAFAQALQRRDLRFRPVLAVVGLCLPGLLVVVGGPLSEGRLDPMTVGFSVVYAVVFGLLGVGPLWIPTVVTPWWVRFAMRRDPARLPVGDVDLRVGPGGGVCRSVRGEMRFVWSDVRGILRSSDVVALLFSPVTGILIPARALSQAPPGLVEQLEGWVQGAGPPSVGGRAEGPRRAPSLEVPDPFAPPDGR